MKEALIRAGAGNGCAVQPVSADSEWRDNNSNNGGVIMALKFKFKSKEEIPADQQALYVERDGAWMLDVDGAVDKSKLDEFRANNIALSNQLAEQKKRFEGIDPDQVRKLAEEKQRLEEAQQLKGGEVDKVVEGRLRTAKTEWDKQFAAVTSRARLAECAPHRHSD